MRARRSYDAGHFGWGNGLLVLGLFVFACIVSALIGLLMRSARRSSESETEWSLTLVGADARASAATSSIVIAARRSTSRWASSPTVEVLTTHV